MASVNEDIDHPFILPHLFFDTGWTAGLLKRAFFGDYDTCADFWNSAEDRQHLRQHLCHRGHSAATPSKMVLVVLHGDGGSFSHQNSLYVVLEQHVWLRHNDLMERVIFTVAELTSATWDTIWKMFSWSMDVMLGRSRLRKMGRCGLRPRRGKCWRKEEARCSRSPETTRTTTCVGFAWPAQGFKTCCTQEPPNRATVRAHESRVHELREHREQVPVWMERSGLRWEHVMIDVLHCIDQAVMSRIAVYALLRGHEFWPQGDIAARADPACERRSAPLVRSESRRPSHPRHALFGPSASQCRHFQAEQSSREFIFGALPR